MKFLINSTKLIFLCVLTFSFFGCEEDEADLPEVIAGFTFTQSATTGTVSFINISEEAQRYEWDFGNGQTSSEINPVRTFEEGTFTVSLQAFNVSGASGVFEDEITITLPDEPVVFDSGLLVNGDFSNGGDGWTGNALNVQTEGGNSFNLANVETAGNAFDVNLSQVVEIAQGTNYILMFDASSDRERTMLAGIGLNEAPFTNTAPSVNLTTTTQTFTLQLSAADFGSANSRIIFDMGADVGVVVIDNVSLVEGGDGSDSAGDMSATGCTDTPVAATALPLDFEGCDTFPAADNFGEGLTSMLAENPDKTGINTSDFVLQIDKPTGSDFFAGIQNTFADNFDLTTTDTFKAKVYSTKANVVFRFELALNPQTDPPTGNPAPVFVTIPNANEWTEVEILFTGLPAGPMAYNQLVIKPDNNQTDDPITNGGTYYIDDLTLEAAGSGGGGGGSLEVCDGGELVNDFETADDSIFNNFGGGVGTIIDNSDTSVNSSAKLAQYVKNAGEPFGGITIGLASNIALDNGTFTIDVNSTSVRQLLFKLEGLNQEIILPTSGTGWETLSYDFTGNTGEVTGITLIMDNGTQGDGTADWTIQFDNIRLCDNGGSGGGGGSLEVCDGGDLVNDFETADDSIFSNFGGGVGTIIDNSDTSVNSSAKLAQYVKNAGEPFGGITIGLASNIALDNGTFTIDVNSTSVRQLLFKLEGLNQEIILPTSGTGWETLSYDFTGNTGEVTGITLIMDNGTQGDGTADWTIQFDNIRLCDNGGSGGGGVTALSALPADFENGEEFSAVFEPASVNGSITANPVSGGINTSANVYTFNKPAGTEFYGGMENVFASPLDMTTTRTFKVKVYSTKPNVVFQFELQRRPTDSGIPNYSLQQTVTNANEWVELTFDFGAVVPGDFNPNIYNGIVIIPDFDTGNNPTSSSETYYIDDIILE